MVENNNEFVYLRILDENIIKKNKEILENTFLIDVDYIDRIFDDIIEGNNWCEYEVNNNFFNFDINENINEILQGIHKITLLMIKEYKFNSDRYFKSDNHFFNMYFDNVIEKYIFENIKFDMYIEYEFSQNNKEITRKDAIEKYMRNFITKNKIDKYSIEDKIENKNRNIIKKIKKLRENCTKWTNIEKNYINKNKKIYDVISNSYIHIIENSLSNRFCDNIENKKVFKSHELSNLISYFENYIINTKSLSEIYYFERSNNILFLLNIHRYITFIQNEDKKMNLYASLMIISYLPNIVYNNELIKIFIDKYSQLYSEKNFAEYIKQFCFELSFFIIPLYEMTFSNILYKYCVRRSIKLSKIQKAIYRNFNINHVKKIILESQIIRNKDIPLKNKHEFQQLSIVFNTYNNSKIFKKRYIINEIGSFKKEFFYNVNNIEAYQKNLKEFILNIINL